MAAQEAITGKGACFSACRFAALANPSSAQFAKAGFVFHPTPANPDNVVCFLCDKHLDGWEEDDDPLVEHLKHVPDCGWAIVAAIEAELGDYAKVHPLDPRMIEARKATFGGHWPYDAKKAWKCKTKQVRCQLLPLFQVKRTY